MSQLDVLSEVFQRVRTDYVDKPDDGQLVENAINGMLSSLDPHSSYMNAKAFHDMQVWAHGEFGGLGIEVTMENGVVKVVSPIDDTPAAKAGILSGDLITALDGEQVQGLTLEQAVDKMRGAVKSPITLTIVRKGKDQPFDVKVVRETAPCRIISVARSSERVPSARARCRPSSHSERTVRCA
jgi:carboxyl-terminal processing protease